MMYHSNIKEMDEKMIFLSPKNLMKTLNLRDIPIYRLPLYQADLENYENSRNSKDSPYASRNEIALPNNNPNRTFVIATEGVKENELKENISANVIPCCYKANNGHSSIYKKEHAPILRTQVSLLSVGVNGSRISQEIVQVNHKSDTDIQCLYTPLISDALNPKIDGGSEKVMNRPLAGNNSKLDLSTLSKRKNTLVAPFCSEIDLYEEIHEYPLLLDLLTEDTELIDKIYRKNSVPHLPILKRLLNGLKSGIDILKSETGQRCWTRIFNRKQKPRN